MSRSTIQSPERGSARIRLLEAARDLIREKGYAGTSVDDLCRAAGVTKGAFFYHFADKAALGVAAAEFWAETTTAFFAAAPYHAPADPLDRVLAYITFRRSIISGPIPGFVCLVGTLASEVYVTGPAIRDAAARSIFGHAATLEGDIAAAMAERGITAPEPASLARYFQAALQGGFVLAKAGNDAALARESLDHLERYVCLLFNQPPGVRRANAN